MIIVVGEILIDRFPSYERIGGAPFNFAFHLKKLGAPVRFVSRVGMDAHGDRILEMLDRCGFSRSDIQIDPARPTGSVDVELNASGVPSFDIRSGVAYDNLYLEHLPQESGWTDTRMIYFGSLLQRSPIGATQLRAMLERKGPRTQCFCDINLRPPHYSADVVEKTIAATDILKLNEDELIAIGQLLGGPASFDALVDWLGERFGIGTRIITSGSAGSTVVTASDRIATPPQKDVAVVDTVGAGDGFAAVFAWGLLNRMPLERVAAAAADFAARICGLTGAVPEDEGVYDIIHEMLGEPS